MRLQETNNYLCILDTPSTDMGVITESEDNLVLTYPKVYSRFYQFKGTNSKVTLGDTIWRVNTKNYTLEPKSIMLSTAHLNCDFELFPTREACEQYIAEKEFETEKKYSQTSIYRALETIVLFSNIKDFDKLSFSEIKRKLETINQQATTAFKQLKNNE